MGHAILDAIGTPTAQPRPRRSQSGGVYNPDNAKAWKEAVQVAWIRSRAKPMRGPVALIITFTFEAPKSDPNRTGHHEQKPDLDNLEKSTMDALTRAGAWEDDCKVAEKMTRKIWGKCAGAHIEIHELKGKE